MGLDSGLPQVEILGQKDRDKAGSEREEVVAAGAYREPPLQKPRSTFRGAGPLECR